jgi:hypothetical protein
MFEQQLKLRAVRNPMPGRNHCQSVVSDEVAEKRQYGRSREAHAIRDVSGELISNIALIPFNAFKMDSAQSASRSLISGLNEQKDVENSFAFSSPDARMSF